MIPGWSIAARVVLIGAVAAAGFVAGARWVQWKWDAARREQADVALEAERMARRVEQQRQAGAQEALNGYARNLRTAHAAAAVARDELGRLRDALVAASPAASDPAAAIGADDAARARFVVGQCAEALSTVAAAADACGAKLSGLQEWARAVAKPF